MKNRKLNPNDVEFLRPLSERPDLEPDAQFVHDLRRRLQTEANRTPKSGRLSGIGIAALTIFTAFASLFLLLNVADNRPEEISKGDEPGEPPAVSTPAELGPPIQIKATEQIVELFSINYGTAEGDLALPQKMKGGTDLTPMSFYVKNDVFYILDNAGKKVVVTDRTEHLFTIQLDENAWLRDIFVDDKNNIYVLNEGNEVSKYDKDGKLIETFMFDRESFIDTGISVNQDGEILVHQSSDLTLNLTTDEISPYRKQFGDTIARAEQAGEIGGRLIITESGKETVIDIPFEDSYGALVIHDLNSEQIIYEKLEIKDVRPISAYSHIYVSDKEGNYLGAVRIPDERSTYYAEHRIRMDNNQIYFMSPEEDGVHFYQLKPGAEKPVIEEPVVDEPEQENQSEDPVVENEPPVENEPTKPFLTEDFLHELHNGNMPGAEVKIGSSLSDLKNQLGEPSRITELEGGYLHEYGTYQYIQPALQDTIIGIRMVIDDEESTGEDFVKAWGEPTSEGTHVHPYEAYSMTYQLNENYVVSLEMNSGRNDPVNYIQLLKIGGE